MRDRAVQDDLVRPYGELPVHLLEPAGEPLLDDLGWA